MEVLKPNHQPKQPRMNSHKNASLTPRGREHLVKNIASQGIKRAAEAAGISARAASRWKRRHQREGVAGLQDRSSRPHRSPRRIDADKVERIEGLRRNQRLGYAQIAERVGVSKSTVGRVCVQAGLAKLPSMQNSLPVRRYTPRTNGKAERFIQTLLREWAYAYRYPSSDVRTAELQPWMQHYNFRRPHSAISHKPPASRLGFDGNNVLRNYS